MASDLASKQCVPCRGGHPPLRGAELEGLHAKLGGDWTVVDEHHLEKEYKFKDLPRHSHLPTRWALLRKSSGTILTSTWRGARSVSRFGRIKSMDLPKVILFLPRKPTKF